MGWITAGAQKCLVDNADLPVVKRHIWCVHHGYAATNIGGKTVYMHRMLLGVPKTMQVDHKNGNKLDNRRKNIRPATSSQNRMNRPLIASRNTSGFKGVSLRRDTRKYRASIRVNGKQYHLGCFMDPKDAARAYNRAAMRLHGEFARLNVLSST